MITLDPEVAEWASEPVDLGHGHLWRPLVLGPANCPHVRPEDLPQTPPELAMLAGLMHARALSARTRPTKRKKRVLTDAERELNERSLETMLAGVLAASALDGNKASDYYDVLLSKLSPTATLALEKMMKLKNYEPQSDFARGHYRKGFLAGEQEGEKRGELRG